MNAAEQEQRYREAMAARRAGEACPLCGHHHSALSPCAPYHHVEPLARPPRELARATDVETSHAAAAANPAGKTTHRLACLAAHARSPGSGLIDDEVASLTGLGTHEAGRRCADLRRLGLIAWRLEDGEPLYRTTNLGRKARVSRITPLGTETLKSQA